MIGLFASSSTSPLFQCFSWRVLKRNSLKYLFGSSCHHSRPQNVYLSSFQNIFNLATSFLKAFEGKMTKSAHFHHFKFWVAQDEVGPKDECNRIKGRTGSRTCSESASEEHAQCALNGVGNAKRLWVWATPRTRDKAEWRAKPAEVEKVTILSDFQKCSIPWLQK